MWTITWLSVLLKESRTWYKQTTAPTMRQSLEITTPETWPCYTLETIYMLRWHSSVNSHTWTYTPLLMRWDQTFIVKFWSTFFAKPLPFLLTIFVFRLSGHVMTPVLFSLGQLRVFTGWNSTDTHNTRHTACTNSATKWKYHYLELKVNCSVIFWSCYFSL